MIWCSVEILMYKTGVIDYVNLVIDYSIKISFRNHMIIDYIILVIDYSVKLLLLKTWTIDYKDWHFVCNASVMKKNSKFQNTDNRLHDIRNRLFRCSFSHINTLIIDYISRNRLHQYASSKTVFRKLMHDVFMLRLGFNANAKNVFMHIQVRTICKCPVQARYTNWKI